MSLDLSNNHVGRSEIGRQARRLLDSVDVSTPAGLRDRALVARIGATLGMRCGSRTGRAATGACAEAGVEALHQISDAMKNAAEGTEEESDKYRSSPLGCFLFNVTAP